MLAEFITNIFRVRVNFWKQIWSMEIIVLSQNTLFVPYLLYVDYDFRASRKFELINIGIAIFSLTFFSEILRTQFVQQEI